MPNEFINVKGPTTDPPSPQTNSGPRPKISVSVRAAGTSVTICFLTLANVLLAAILVSTMKSNVTEMVEASDEMAGNFARIFLHSNMNSLNSYIKDSTAGVRQAAEVAIAQHLLDRSYNSSFEGAVMACRAAREYIIHDDLHRDHDNTETGKQKNNLDNIDATIVTYLSFTSENRSTVDFILRVPVGSLSFTLLNYTSKIRQRYNFRRKDPSGMRLVKTSSLPLDPEIFFPDNIPWSSIRIGTGAFLTMAHVREFPNGRDLVVVHFTLSFLRKSLQSLVFEDGEPHTPLGYDDPTYHPKTNETVLCVVEVETTFLIACSHGFVIANSPSGNQVRVSGNESLHPVIGPIFQHMQSMNLDESSQRVTRILKLPSSGTTRFPIYEEKQYFVNVKTHDPAKEFSSPPRWKGVLIVPAAKLLRLFDEKTKQVEDSNARKIALLFVCSGVIFIAGVAAAFAFETALTKPLLQLVSDMQSVSRSEERRVGKECRSRWSPYH
eukprot:TRINITY_DN1416_c3_g1_i1.p1 TRINITY_DN1416_c3_g1~~TRINITY_DN1416_c3_g1_i1.p1  ORF type:complete len:494 (+),score=50.74 TRINITY_DN1416_c3_g1_i1:1160-2641(+)